MAVKEKRGMVDTEVIVVEGTEVDLRLVEDIEVVLGSILKIKFMWRDLIGAPLSRT